MLCLFGHLVAMCCDMLGVVGSSLKLLKFFMQHLRMLHDVYSFGQVRGTILRQSMRTSSICSTQHVVTRRNRVVKRTQYVAPNNVAICCDHLARACKYWANNVAICCAKMLQFFGRGFTQNNMPRQKRTLVKQI